MAVAYGEAPPPGLLSQQYPPPLLPKPGKDNLRLQKLLKRTAKKKSSVQTSQSAVPFRSSLSPVNEASPDLEHSDNSTPPKTPDTPFTLHAIQPAPRFSVRPLYQHVASPYPRRAAYGRAPSPQALATPPYSYFQDVTTSSSMSLSVPLSAVSPAPGRVDQPTEPRRAPLEAAAVPECGAGGSTPSKPKSPGPTPYPAATGARVVIRPLTVLAPIVKSKSPRPNFKATEPSRSPKPMFDVPQIRMYTASTSYYETSRTPPVYDTAALTAIGSTAPRSKTPAETKQDEAGRGTTPTPQPSASVTDSQRKAATSDVTTAAAASNTTTGAVAAPNVETMTPDIRRATPTPDAKRSTLTSDTTTGTAAPKMETTVPTLETTTSDARRATPTPQRSTLTSDVKTVAPLSVVRVKTPTYEFEMSRITAGRPRTPARASTPAFEISRPNPLLFAVTPVPVEPERSSSSQTLSAASSSSVSQSVKITDAPEALLNGDVHSDVTPTADPPPENLEKPKPESDSTRETTRAAPVGVLTSAPAATGSHRPKTPTFEASRLLSTSPGYKRPKTPTYGTPRSGVSPVAFQRPKTPTHTTQKSSYRGLTPAEYAAYGGIKTYAPAFGIGGTMVSTQEEVKPSAEPKTPVTGRATVGGVAQPQQVEEKVAPIPTIVVSQASESSGKIVTKVRMSHHVAARQETISTEETPTARSQTSAADETKAKAPEAKRPPSEELDPLKAVKKLLGKDKVQTTGQQQKESKSEVLKQKEPAAAATTKESAAAPVKTKPAGRTEDEGKDQKVEEAASSVTSASEKKEGENPAPAEPSLKVFPKPKGMKAKASGWSRLKKHMVVEQEEPRFPEAEPQRPAGEQPENEGKQQDEEAAGEKVSAQDDRQASGSPKATRMWDAVLFQMFSSKENIMHQIELSKSETEQSEDVTADESREIPSFAYRLPVLLFSPKFDAKKLKEAASRPVTKISTVFEMGLIGRKGKEEEPKDFNRTARGFRNM